MNRVNTNNFRKAAVAAAVGGITMIIMGLLPAFPWYVFIPIGTILLYISLLLNDNTVETYAGKYTIVDAMKEIEKANRQRKDKKWLKTVFIDETTNTEQIAIDMTGPAYNLHGELNEHIEILNKGETEKNEIILKKLTAKWNDIFERKDFFEGITPKNGVCLEGMIWDKGIVWGNAIVELSDGRLIKTRGAPLGYMDNIASAIKYNYIWRKLEYTTKDKKVLSIGTIKAAFGAVIILSFTGEESTIKMHIYITPHGAPSLPDLREPDIIDAQINVKLPKNKADAQKVTLDDIFAKLGIENFWEKTEIFVKKSHAAYRKAYAQKRKEDMQKQKEDSKEKVKADMEKLNKALSELDTI